MMWIRKIAKRKTQFAIIMLLTMMATAILTACISFTVETQRFVKEYYSADKHPIGVGISLREDAAMREQQAKEKERGLYASISHDLKTPLAIITGYLEQILYGVAKTPEQIRESAEHALSKAKILNKLTEDILEHSKAQLNQLSIEKQEVYADTFFERILEEYEQEALLQKYEFSYAKPPKVLISIDPDRIMQVVQNILGNSVKYRKNSLKIEVTFEIAQQKEHQRILIVNIHDNGKGIEAADLPFIFDLFYRGEKTRTQNIKGSGIGLNISKYIVEQHGGTIECDSIEGIGTTVSFSIPIL